jgi:hypothetical protein
MNIVLSTRRNPGTFRRIHPYFTNGLSNIETGESKSILGFLSSIRRQLPQLFYRIIFLGVLVNFDTFYHDYFIEVIGYCPPKFWGNVVISIKDYLYADWSKDHTVSSKIN